jgi:hypothetical protein
LFNVAEVIRCQFDLSRSNVLFQSLQPARAWDGHNPGLLEKQPCERDLTRCDAFAFGSLGEEIDQGVVGLACLSGETRDRGANIVVRETSSGINGASKKMYASDIRRAGTGSRKPLRASHPVAPVYVAGDWLAFGGRPGSRHCVCLAMPSSRTALLRLVRVVPDRPVVAPRVHCVDEFALRRGRRYGTILVEFSDALSRAGADAERDLVGYIRNTANEDWRTAADLLACRWPTDGAKRDRPDVSLDLKRQAEVLGAELRLNLAELVREAERLAAGAATRAPE